jgi:hypothetical protein
MPQRCVNFAQPLYTGMPHRSKHEIPTFEQKASTVRFSRGPQCSPSRKLRWPRTSGRTSMDRHAKYP